jgi:hypothetical protein
MTPKEKAKELVEKYLNTIIHFPYIDTEDGNCIGTGYMTHNSAVRCAINAVDEIIECTRNGLGTTKFSKEYWEQVKEELKKL